MREPAISACALTMLLIWNSKYIVDSVLLREALDDLLLKYGTNDIES